MRAIVTGGAGFIGSHLLDALVARGAAALILDDLSTGSETNLRGALDGGAELQVADVTDPAAVADACERFGPDVIFHLAAQADVRRSVADPAFDARANLIGTINVLEAARNGGGCPVVFAATGGAVYGEGDGRDLPFDEASPPEPLTPYGASKLAAESYVSIYGRLHGVPGISLRFGNVYGPRQDPHGEAGVVAIFCGRLLDGVRPVVYGDGSQTRDYIYVADTVEALLAAGDALLGGEVSAGTFNVGTGRETTVLELLELLVRATGSDAEPELAPHRPGELHRVSIDPAAAAAALGWQARVALEDGLGQTFEHLRVERAG